MIVLTGPGNMQARKGGRAHRELTRRGRARARTRVGQERSACRHGLWPCRRRPAAAQERAAVSRGAANAVGACAWPRQDRLRSVFLASPSYELSSS